MAITICEKLVTDWYTPESEKDEAEPTRFRIKPMNGSQALQVLNTENLQLALTFGLIDWENVKNANGEQVEFKKPRISMLHANLLSEIANEIVSRSNLTGDEIKNS